MIGRIKPRQNVIQLWTIDRTCESTHSGSYAAEKKSREISKQECLSVPEHNRGFSVAGESRAPRNAVNQLAISDGAPGERATAPSNRAVC